MKKIFLILIIFTISFTFFVQPANAITQEREPFEYKLMVPLPTPNGTATSTSGIVNYLMILYYFLFGIAGVMAMGSIVYSGFQWITSGSSHSNITQAKARISNSILGLIILLSSWVILQTINPNLTKLKEPYVQFMTWDEEFKDDGASNVGGTPPDWCVTDGITQCFDYNGLLGNATFSKCESDPCNVPNGPCFKNGLNQCGGCGGPPPVITCDRYHFEDRCAPNPCGVTTGCQWVAGCIPL